MDINSTATADSQEHMSRVTFHSSRYKELRRKDADSGSCKLGEAQRKVQGMGMGSASMYYIHRAWPHFCSLHFFPRFSIIYNLIIILCNILTRKLKKMFINKDCKAVLGLHVERLDIHSMLVSYHLCNIHWVLRWLHCNYGVNFHLHD